MDTLQTQWSWLLQITKCIDVHLKENAAYSQVRVKHWLLLGRALNMIPQEQKHTACDQC